MVPIQVYYALLFIGWFSIIVPPIIPLAQNNKLYQREFALQLFLPMTIGLLFFLIGASGLLGNLSLIHIQAITGLVIIGAIGFSLATTFLSFFRMRFAAD